mmetsp:Transcript_26680/g.67824  ORF Transcript_26680/g.67824 Transcript_26680/m.67824 type:complete len:267 (+) Transcript_26680:795-1595(+)
MWLSVPKSSLSPSPPFGAPAGAEASSLRLSSAADLVLPAAEEGALVAVDADDSASHSELPARLAGLLSAASLGAAATAGVVLEERGEAARRSAEEGLEGARARVDPTRSKVAAGAAPPWAEAAGTAAGATTLAAMGEGFEMLLRRERREPGTEPMGTLSVPAALAAAEADAEGGPVERDEGSPEVMVELADEMLRSSALFAFSLALLNALPVRFVLLLLPGDATTVRAEVGADPSLLVLTGCRGGRSASPLPPWCAWSAELKFSAS